MPLREDEKAEVREIALQVINEELVKRKRPVLPTEEAIVEEKAPIKNYTRPNYKRNGLLK